MKLENLQPRPEYDPQRGALLFGPQRGEIFDLPVDPEKVASFEVTARATLRERVQPQLVFRGITLCILSDRRGVVLSSVRLANCECLLERAAVEIFRPSDVLLTLDLPTCSIAQVLELVFENESDHAVRLKCWLEGRYLR